MCREMTHPVRIEYFGDDIESIRYFDIASRRSIEQIGTIDLPNCKEQDRIENQGTLLDYLPENTVVIIEETNELIEFARIFRDRAWHPEALWEIEDILKQVNKFDSIHINRFTSGICDVSFAQHVNSIQDYLGRGLEALEELCDCARLENKEVIIVCDNPAQQQRTKENIETDREITDNTTGNKRQYKGHALPKKLSLKIGVLAEGFSLPDVDTIVIGHHELFGVRQVRRKLKAVRKTESIESFNDLSEGELVVHFGHGIGKYRGMKLLTKNGREEEYLAVEFADQAIIHVPAGKIDLIHRYVGSGAKEAKLSQDRRTQLAEPESPSHQGS